MRKLYYRFYLKYHGLPHRKQVGTLIALNTPLNKLRRDVASAYSKGERLDKIGEHFRIPRERVRQLLLSIVRG